MKKVLIGSTIAVGLLFAGAGSPSAASIQGVGGVDLSSTDIETSMLTVQTQRATLLEGQLQTQLAEVQKKNEQIANFNAQLDKLEVEKAATTDKAKQDELQAQIQDVKNQIDSLSNSQNMDMLRLQSLSNKRNEAFDTMTNFIKKMQESRSSIIGNMR
ncbi:hypothetical protein MKX47_10040 [Solibacillus sp. FSL R7-0668]|uniref:hypothetical protein n=1 Tax=Solibacillus sp. FSL R7-0668 TaxID=2921688 RepID=UPI0030F76BD6